MLRIVEEAPADNGRHVLRLEGRAVGRWVDELRRTADGALSRNHASVTIDLAELVFADAAGVRAMRDLADRGVTFVNCSPFTEAQLQSVSVECPRSEP